eukprot:gnl/MRDRNA2_/MRDRNA2_27094_c0_seq1.p1 gnl/MRDRNA2_/MRDRNA2_27094_c0~~gnl/MRDRNA2_/MRDRNA2_27094_c0_seq1.p1  ORF type:complete len:481 (+),score=68.55 gnl/MRDRNA2_/MRDRNA2_27094_c0_seq1:97-1539(+)
MLLLWFILVITTMIEHCDMAMFPALFRVFEEQLPGATPTTLGQVLMIQGIASCASLPFWGYWVDRRDRLATLTWTQSMLAMMMFCTAYVTSVSALAAFSSMRAICACSFTTICQCLIATRFSSLHRGQVLGLIICAGSFGRIIGMMFAGGMSHAQVLGYPGWRVAVFVLGAITLLLGMVVSLLCYMSPKLAETGKPLANNAIKTSFLEDLKYLVTIRSYLLVILQGVFASAVASTGQYTTMMFQYMRYSDVQSASLSGIVCLGFGFGALGGGIASDALERLYPDRGRVLLGVFAVIVVMMMLTAFVLGVDVTELDQGSFGMTALCIFTFAAFKAVPYAGTVKPILIDVVPRRLAGTCNAWAAAIDGSIAAFLGAPIFGMLAERFFGYTPTSDTIPDMPAELRKHNMQALVRAFCSMALTFTILGFFIFSLLIRTYPHDKIHDELSITDERTKLLEQLSKSNGGVPTKSTNEEKKVKIDGP